MDRSHFRPSTWNGAAVTLKRQGGVSSQGLFGCPPPVGWRFGQLKGTDLSFQRVFLARVRIRKDRNVASYRGLFGCSQCQPRLRTCDLSHLGEAGLKVKLFTNQRTEFLRRNRDTVSLN